MNRIRTRRSWALFLAAGLGWAAGAKAAPPVDGVGPGDPAAVLRRMAAAPYRYGGTLAGLPFDRPGPAARAPLHLSIGLDGPAPDGNLRGEAILFDANRRLVAMGPVTGGFGAGTSAGTTPCTLRLAMPAARITLLGTCTAALLSGEIRIAPDERPTALRRLVSWWGDHDRTGEYWLTPGSFDPAPVRPAG